METTSGGGSFLLRSCSSFLDSDVYLSTFYVQWCAGAFFCLTKLDSTCHSFTPEMSCRFSSSWGQLASTQIFCTWAIPFLMDVGWEVAFGCLVMSLCALHVLFRLFPMAANLLPIGMCLWLVSPDIYKRVSGRSIRAAVMVKKKSDLKINNFPPKKK